ncbi:MAG: hypothetical protein QF473_40465, partial [Planctomycetota bacterium]|nr:hypothetical protein [Planctomycetota bacterium]
MSELENEFLTNILMIPDKVWWWMPGAGQVNGRHEMFKNPRYYLACQHLLKTGRPNAAAKAALEKVCRGPLEYLQFASSKAYRSDHEGVEADHGWQNGLWFSLLNGDWNHFMSGMARDAARYALLQTDNLGGLSGHIQYGAVQNLNATSDVRNAIRTAAWFYREPGFRWVLENMPLRPSYSYSFPFNLPLDHVSVREPVEWLGVQSQPLSPFSYDAAKGKTEWGQLNVPREMTVDLLAFREGFAPDDQYLCIDGFQAHFQPKGLNSVLRYVDRGKLFLVAHTGKEGNYYKSGVVVSSGTQTQPEPCGVRLAALKNWPEGFSFSQTVAPGMNGCDWERSIFWKRGEYFLFIDRLVALKPGKFNLTATWRTGHRAEWKDDAWKQRQSDVTFYIKPAYPLFQESARQPEE